jgi:putative transposase
VVAGAQVIAIEDLAVKAMQRGMGRRAFRRGVADAGLGEIRRQLTYKAAWLGRTVVVVDRFYPSSKTCSGCGQHHAGLQLRERSWQCSACGASHHRDRNAAINIEREGLRLLAETSTPRSGGIDARGESASAAGSPSPAGHAALVEPRTRLSRGKPRLPRAGGLEPLKRGKG